MIISTTIWISLHWYVNHVFLSHTYRKNQGQIGIPAYSYATGFLPVDQATGLRQAAYPFMIPGQYVATQMPYQHQVSDLWWVLSQQ